MDTINLLAQAVLNIKTPATKFKAISISFYGSHRNEKNDFISVHNFDAFEAVSEKEKWEKRLLQFQIDGSRHS